MKGSLIFSFILW